MKRKKGDSSARPAIFHADIYDPNAKQQVYESDKSKLPYARTENRLFKVPRQQKRDKNI